MVQGVGASRPKFADCTEFAVSRLIRSQCWHCERLEGSGGGRLSPRTDRSWNNLGTGDALPFFPVAFDIHYCLHEKHRERDGLGGDRDRVTHRERRAGG